MDGRNISWIIGASALALILLVLIQANWLLQSRQLIEEQFDQKVTMALCSAVETLRADHTENVEISLSCKENADACHPKYLETTLGRDELQQTLHYAFQRYDIDLDFDYEVFRRNEFEAIPAIYCAPMEPLTRDDQYIRVYFRGKDEYVIKKMGLMAASSVLILLSVCTLFTLTMIRLIRQRQLHSMSVEFFNNMAHEFRTPLTNIHLALNLLKKRQPESTGNRFFGIIQSESRHLMQQVERILHVAKLDYGEYQLEWEDLDLNDLVSSVIEDMTIQVSEKQGRVSLESDGPVILSADRMHLANAIRNIIDNALKYCTKPPELFISIERDVRQVRIHFQDNGIGLSDQHQKQLFAPFVRGDFRDLPRDKGFGLGLAYVKRVVELHGGAVAVAGQEEEGAAGLVLPCL